MNDQGDWRLPHTERAVTGILRAMAQLLLALAGDGAGDGERGRAPGGRPAMRSAAERVVREESSVPEPRPAREPRFAPPPMSEGGDDVELLLADARARAHELIDDSVRRAQEVLTRRPEQPAEGGEALRRTVAELVADMRALQRRLDAIEGLLRGAQRPAAAPVEPAWPEPDAARAAASRAVEAAPPAGPGVAADTATAPTAHAPPPQQPSPPPSAAAPPVGAPPAAAPAMPSTTPPAVVPRVAPVVEADRQDATPPVLLAPVAPRAEPPLPPVGQASAAAVGAGARPGPSVVFAASEGTVILRIAPVAGFQGLMRVQDALAQVPGVREAGVEAYAQGEARLRLQLAGNLDTEQLATSLSGQLGREARLAAASLTDRSITMTLD